MPLGQSFWGPWFAFAYETLISKTARSRRTASIEVGEQLIKRLRLGGIDEREIQSFVARFAGRQWEEYFCALFDYDVMRSVRQQMISLGQHTGKARFQPWRDGIVDRLDAKLAERRGEQDQQLLTRVEQASLTSQGFRSTLPSSRPNRWLTHWSHSPIKLAMPTMPHCPTLNVSRWS